MEVYPKYGKNIIVGVKLVSDFHWYIADKEIWYLDLRKFIDAFIKKGYVLPDPNDFSGRFNIDIVNDVTAIDFVNCIEKYRVETNELTNLLVNKKYDHLSEIAPSLFIDFDEKMLQSQFPEPASFEKYIPDGWTGNYEAFLNRIPQNFQYWIVSGKNLLAEVSNE